MFSIDLLMNELIATTVGVIVGVVVTRLWLWWPTRHRPPLSMNDIKLRDHGHGESWESDRFSALHAALRAAGSADTHTGDDARPPDAVRDFTNPGRRP